MRNQTATTSQALSRLIVEGMQEKKAKNIVVMDLRQVKGAVTDFFVIGTGSSDTQVRAIQNSVEDIVEKEIQERPWHVEGSSVAEWILMDYIDVVVHVFQKDKRSFYGLEELWGDAKFTHYSDSPDDMTA